MKSEIVTNDFGRNDENLFGFADSNGRVCGNARQVCENFNLNYDTVRKRIERDLKKEDSDRYYRSSDIGFVLNRKDFCRANDTKSKAYFFSNRFSRLLGNEYESNLLYSYRPEALRSRFGANIYNLKRCVRARLNDPDNAELARKYRNYIKLIRNDFNLMFNFYAENYKALERYGDVNELNIYDKLREFDNKKESI